MYWEFYNVCKKNYAKMYLTDKRQRERFNVTLKKFHCLRSKVSNKVLKHPVDQNQLKGFIKTMHFKRQLIKRKAANRILIEY